MTRRRAVVVSRRRHAVCIRSSVSARCSHCRAVQAASWPQPSRLTAAYHRSRTRDVTEQLGRQGRCRRDQRVHRRVTLGDEAPNETAVRSAAHADCARSPPRNAAARPSMRLRSVPRLTGRRRGRRPWWLVALRAAGTGCAVVAHRAEVLRGARYGDRHRSGHRRELHTVAVSSDSAGQSMTGRKVAGGVHGRSPTAMVHCASARADRTVRSSVNTSMAATLHALAEPAAPPACTG